ncbi:hypothetical protein pv_43 [Pithovirus sibericum]|uniref:Uncharacterized protein n=1 Tax=Pithovirus sibericum TaxID=1450746 RepID=W5SA21_9VIRU|nr:hypothetical protein pv_43 [Pithovirus sibericum]AHH01610.1 hypothetical protein pv_43 [Pithovirus sibericum]WIL05174.1 hypothetical protein pmam_135 [Pithovirus mammoth]
MSFELSSLSSSLIIEDLKRNCKGGKMDENMANIIRLLANQQKRIDKQEKKINELENLIKRQTKKIREMKREGGDVQCYTS